MMRTTWRLPLNGAGLCLATLIGIASSQAAAELSAQQVTVGGGQIGLSDSFSESFGLSGGPGTGWRLSAVQGSSRSIIGSAGSVTMANGASGWMAHGQVRPFVMGFVPVVGARVFSPVEEKLARLRSGELPSPSSPTTADQTPLPQPAAARRVPAHASSPPTQSSADDPPLRLGR